MAKKVMVSFPDEFLRVVDRIARDEHRSRSELLREAVRVYIAVRRSGGQWGEDLGARSAAARDAVGRQTSGSGMVS